VYQAAEITGLSIGTIRMLRQWMGASRYVYNQTIAYLKQPGTIANWIEIKKWLLPGLPEWFCIK
jgi:putative transposase